MPIQITCTNCHARFQVSDKFAGQTGPCPKCKSPIKIPEKSEEVVVHAPEDFGPTIADGQSTLRPIEREETRFSITVTIGIVTACLVTLIAAFFLGKSYGETEGGVPLLWRAIGAVILGPPLALGCYSFLRDQELEPFRGSELYIRVSICGIVYAVMWGVYGLLSVYLLNGEVQLFSLIYLAPIVIAGGALASHTSLDLDFTSASIHFAVYIAGSVFVLFLTGFEGMKSALGLVLQ